MSFLDRLGLAPKPGRYSRRAGLRTDSRRLREPTGMSRRDVGIRVGLFLALTLLALNAFPRSTAFYLDAEEGDIWTDEDVIAPFEFSIRLPPEEVASRQDSVLRTEAPIFTERPDALAQTLARIDSVDARLDSVFTAYVDWQGDRQRVAEARAATPNGTAQPVDVADLAQTARRDSARYFQKRQELDLSLTPRQWDILLRSAYRVAIRGGTPVDDILLSEAARMSREQLGRGVLDVSRDSVKTASFLVQNLQDRTETEHRRIDVLGIDESDLEARRSLFAAFPGKQDTVAIGVSLFKAARTPSLLYNQEATARKRAEALRAISTTRGRVDQNAIVIRRNDKVTAERYQMLVSLEDAQRQRTGGATRWMTIPGRTILVLSALALFFLYMYLLRPRLFGNDRQIALACLVLGVVLVAFFIANLIGGAAPYGVPVALAAILLTIVFDSRVGSFATMTLASLGGLVFGYDYPWTFATLIVGVLAVFSVRDVKNRSQILASAGLVLLGYVIVLLGFSFLRAEVWTDRLLADLIAVVINATLILLAPPLLWAMERGFGVTTDITLLELSDTNRTLLKRLSMQAPGTFNHSLQVANLAEAAADAIGANALRARVGALYHDIGKMLKPEYFVENQQPGDNPHEKLKPSMSALVIAAHVKEGLQLGREQNLPTVVRDFIGTHHGTGLIEFFYRKAQEQEEDPSVVDESDYRYPGPRPQTNEQAIVMLADSVEAASRSLEKPTPRRLESLIDAIVAARVADGQLDEASLTFADLARIKDAFHALLCGIYHFRVKYPDQAPEEAEGVSDNLVSEPMEGEVEVEGVATPEERSTMG